MFKLCIIAALVAAVCADGHASKEQKIEFVKDGSGKIIGINVDGKITSYSDLSPELMAYTESHASFAELTQKAGYAQGLDASLPIMARVPALMAKESIMDAVTEMEDKVDNASGAVEKSVLDLQKKISETIDKDIAALKAECEYAYEYKSNGKCVALKTCKAGVEYQSKYPTKSADRECKASSKCEAGKTYETSPLTAISDRVCTKVTACKTDETEASAPTTVTDRVCIKTTELTKSTTGTSNAPATSCQAIKAANPLTKSGIFYIAQSGKFSKMQVYCDMDNHGGGWTLVGRGIGTRCSCWRTTGGCNTGYWNNGRQTFKYPDTVINAVGPTMIRMQGAGVPHWSLYTNDYFWKMGVGGCPSYKHTTTARGPCNTVCENTAMNFRCHSGYPHGGHWGLGDWGGRFDSPKPDTYGWDGDRNWGSNDCLHTSHSGSCWYYRKPGTKRCGDGYCHGGHSRCDIWLWAR